MKTKSTRHDTLLLVPKWRIKMLFQKGRFCLLLMILLLTSGAFAQTLTVTGKVADENGESLSGLNVTIKGTAIGQTTDAEGNYSINISDNDKILVFSYVGFLSQEIPVGNETVLNVTLVQDRKQLEEVVIVGYGTQKKVNLTGSVSSVSSKDLTERPATNSANLLQGGFRAYKLPRQRVNPEKTMQF